MTPAISTTKARSSTSIALNPSGTPSFIIKPEQTTFKYQYANIYYIRLRLLRKAVEERAVARWKSVKGNPVLVPRILEMTKMNLCIIIGTLYIDMPLKPNVLDDIARDKSLPAPPPLAKINSPEDAFLLEDESGRVTLVGDVLAQVPLVTGVILGVLGMENNNGEFEVVDFCYAGEEPRHSLKTEGAMEVDEETDGPSSQDSPEDEWVALLSGLNSGGASFNEAQAQMLVEYLTGEGSGPGGAVPPAQISRLIIAGNSLAPFETNASSLNIPDDKKPKKYGNDASSTVTSHSTDSLSGFVLDICRALPVHILPGGTDPAPAIMPQQPFPRGLFGAAAKLPSLICEPNPTYFSLHAAKGKHHQTTRSFIAHSGQPLDDMYKYVSSPPITRLALLEATLRWRHLAPTAPDTLWCHPYFASDPFIMKHTPDVYVVGGQRRLATKLVSFDPKDDDSRRCRIVMVPSFSETGVLVLLNLRTLEIKSVKFGAEFGEGMEMNE